MHEIIEMAKGHSLDAQIVRKDFQHSELSYLYSKKEMKPLLSLTTTPIQYNKDVVQRYSYNDDRTYYRTQNYMYSSANLRLTQNVGFLGGSIYLDSDCRLYQSLGTNGLKQFTSIPLRLGYSQNLIGYNAFRWQKKTECQSYIIANKKMLHGLEEVAIDALEKYITVGLLTEELKLADSNLHICDTLCTEAKLKLQYGRITKKEYSELLLEKSKADCIYKQVKIDLIDAEFNLRRMLNLPEETTLDVSMQSLINCVNKTIVIPILDAMQYAIENSTDILAFEKDIVVARQNIAKQKIKRYFDASINASIGLHQISESLRGAYIDPLNEQTFSISLSVPIADSGRGRTQYLQALKNLEIKNIKAEKAKDDICEKIKQSVLKHQLLYLMIGNAKETYRISCMTYDETISEYRIGRWNTNSIAIAFANRQTALIDYYRSIKDYLMNYYMIRSITLFDFEKNEAIKFELNI